MTRLTPAWIAGIALAACSSSGGGADVNSFATSLAGSVCHFYYHCCTPVDRQHVSNDFGAGFNATATTYGFDDETSCKAKLPALFQTATQPYQEEVARNRFTYDQAAAQKCLDTVNKAGDECKPDLFFGAQPPLGMLVDPNLPSDVYIDDAGPSACNFLSFLKGKVATGGNCISDLECAAPGAACGPPDGGPMGVPVDAGPYTTMINSATTICLAPVGIAQPCDFTGQPGHSCGPGSCCGTNVDGGGFFCVSYVPENGPCSEDNLAVRGRICNNQCAVKPCDPVKDYCRAVDPNDRGQGGTCLARIPDNQQCDGNDNQSPSCSCQHSCEPNGVFCVGQSHQITYSVCSGNPEGI